MRNKINECKNLRQLKDCLNLNKIDVDIKVINPNAKYSLREYQVMYKDKEKLCETFKEVKEFVIGVCNE